MITVTEPSLSWIRLFIVSTKNLSLPTPAPPVLKAISDLTIISIPSGVLNPPTDEPEIFLSCLYSKSCNFLKTSFLGISDKIIILLEANFFILVLTSEGYPCPFV